MKYFEWKRKFVCTFFLIDWAGLQLGFHIDVRQPNIEIHIPFGFFKIGWQITNLGIDATKKPLKFFVAKELGTIVDTKEAVLSKTHIYINRD